ncbi:hypothetical protein BY996DRAFT_6419482 [Phakopsora pachyrhizi]|nr:hypothetical protein BY996DRAFT_6419482 [Phakopsora pachyrhizi]
MTWLLDLSRFKNNPELLPNTIGSNTYQIKSHLYRILEEVHQLVKLAPQDKNLSSEAERQNVVRRKRKSQTLQEIMGEELNREKGNSLVKNEEIQTPRPDGKMSKKRKI